MSAMSEEAEAKLIAVAAEMNARYTVGDAYPSQFAFDKLRVAERHRVTRNLVKKLPVKRVLEVGPGSSGAVSSIFGDVDVWALDLSVEALRKLKAASPNVTCVAAPAECICECRLPLFDLVMAEEVIEHCVDVPRVLDGLRDCIKAGGWLCLSTPNRDSLHCRVGKLLGIEVPYCSPDHVHEFRYLELLSLLLDHGFEVVRSAGVGMAPYWALESVLGDKVRELTDTSEVLNLWLNDIARDAPAEYGFLQVHLLRRR